MVPNSGGPRVQGGVGGAGAGGTVPNAIEASLIPQRFPLKHEVPIFSGFRLRLGCPTTFSASKATPQHLCCAESFPASPPQLPQFPRRPGGGGSRRTGQRRLRPPCLGLDDPLEGAQVSSPPYDRSFPSDPSQGLAEKLLPFCNSQWLWPEHLVTHTYILNFTTKGRFSKISLGWAGFCQCYTVHLYKI